MDNFNLSHLLNKFTNYPIIKGNPAHAPRGESAQNNPAPAFNESLAQPKPMVQVQMNTIAGVDRALYVKDIMKLPTNLNELFYMLQKNLTWNEFSRQFNQFMNAQRPGMSQTQAQILAQLQGMSLAQIQAQMGSQLQSSLKNLQINANGLINLADIAALIQTNGKDAISKLISAMANAAQKGVDISQIKDMARLINACVAAAGENNPTQTLKALMLLYLPWLPLSDGTGFDLEIEAQEGGQEGDCILTVTITTVNFGNVHCVLILETSNSVHVSIECGEDFPKDELNLRIENEQKCYSMQSVISFSTHENTFAEEKSAHAKINMSQTNEINPYLLLMAHALIRSTIEIDNNASAGIVSHLDG